jgi:hypothetical protein
MQSIIQPQQKMKTKNMTTLHLRKSISRQPWRRGCLLIALALTCFGLWPSPKAFGVSSPPDGGYPGGNTAEGDNALYSLTTAGFYNTANGLEALFSDTNGSQNTATGAFALPSNTTGNNNTANGFGVLYNNISGSKNTANGVYALYSNTTGDDNTANGLEALFSNTTGDQNTANGGFALSGNVAGNNNTATGFGALYDNMNGGKNTANGVLALYSNTNGDDNTANGAFALFSNTTGYDNTANGVYALYSNTTGIGNTANGFKALYNNTGYFNTANGAFALFNNTTGYHNTATGYAALYSNSTGTDNVAIGIGAGFSITGSSNTCLGASADQNGAGNFNVYIGANQNGTAGENNTTRIANIYATVQPVVGMDPDYVSINSTGRLGRANISSRRYKHDIKAMDKASEAIFALKPVTFRYKEEFDPTQTLAFGLIAEEVEKVNSDLVGRNHEGEPESVRYEQINAMLLNEFLKEHRKVEQLEATIVQQRKDFQAAAAHEQKQIEALTAGLQKVSAQVEMSRPAPQMVLNNQ